MDASLAPLELCQYQTWRGDLYEPPEWCDNEANEGGELCDEHDPDRQEPDWDSIRKDRRDRDYD